MNRFYVDREIAGDTLSIADADQFHHLRDVLRLKIGGEVTVFDSGGNEYTCVIRDLDGKQALLTVKARRRAERKGPRITIACAIPKNARMDDIIDNVTQAGVDSIVPMETERVVIKLDDSRKQARLERWRRIARSAARQSQRSSIPLVQPVASLESVISGSQGFDLKLIPTLAGERRPIKEVLAGTEPGNILVLIGPEGDFTPQEIGLAQGAGFIPVSLGESVLRVATAAIAVVSYLRFSLAT